LRLDKYLKVSRIIKRRVLAKEASQNNLVYVNDKLAKPSTIIKINDILTLYLGFKIISVKVISLENKNNNIMYELIKEEKR
jgi:ribosomal 50S subunit-recycling heat shock protein